MLGDLDHDAVGKKHSTRRRSSRDAHRNERRGGVLGPLSNPRRSSLRRARYSERKSEILTLRWDDVDRTAGEFRLRDGKRGPRMVPLTTPVLKVLDRIERVEGNPWVIRSQKEGICLPDLTYYWNRIQAYAGLEGVRIHDIRHSFASRALALGEGLPIIGRLLGHCRVETTARYAHLARDSVRESAERIAVSIAADIS